MAHCCSPATKSMSSGHCITQPYHLAGRPSWCWQVPTMPHAGNLCPAPTCPTASSQQAGKCTHTSIHMYCTIALLQRKQTKLLHGHGQSWSTRVIAYMLQWNTNPVACWLSMDLLLTRYWKKLLSNYLSMPNTQLLCTPLSYQTLLHMPCVTHSADGVGHVHRH